MNARRGERRPTADEPPEPSFFLLWTLAGTAGLAPAAIALPLYLNISAAASPVVRVLALLLLGAAEGLALGLAQVWILRRRQLLDDTRYWIAATAAGSAAAWALIGLCGLFSAPPAELTPLIFALWGAHGAVVGAVQWLAVRRQTPYFSAWIAVCVLAWIAGEKLAFPSLVALSNGADPSLMIVPRLCMGLVIAAVTGVGLLLLRSDLTGEQKDF